MLQLFIDTAGRTAAEPLLRTGLFAGLTTNPLLLQREGLTWDGLPGLYEWAVERGAREVFFQATGADAAAMAARGRLLARIGPNVTVKVPATAAGAEAATALTGEGVRVLLTAVYHPAQALVAAAAGARYLAPYVGRMSDHGRPGLAQVSAMAAALRATGAGTQILAASVRGVEELAPLAAAGVTAFALPPPVAAALLADPLTERAAAEFEQAAAALSPSPHGGATP